LAACLGLALATLTSASAQDSSSLGDLGRTAREPQKNAAPHKVVTDEDLPARRDADGSQELAVTDAEVRSALQRVIGKLFYFDFANFVDALDKRHGWAVQTANPSTVLLVLPLLFNNLEYDRLDIVNRDLGVQFPGRQQWDSNIGFAATNLNEALSAALPKLHTIVDENKSLLVKRNLNSADYASTEKVRSDLVEALLPVERWAVRALLLLQDGQSRMQRYLASDAGRQPLDEYLQRRAPEAEHIMADGLSRIVWSQHNSKQALGRYECDPANDTVRVFTEYSKYSYRLRVVGCTADHFQAFLDAPAADGSQGRGFCVDETGVFRVSRDGTTTDCLTRGIAFHDSNSIPKR
jgi:hypothetical protein